MLQKSTNNFFIKKRFTPQTPLTSPKNQSRDTEEPADSQVSLFRDSTHRYGNSMPNIRQQLKNSSNRVSSSRNPKNPCKRLVKTSYHYNPNDYSSFNKRSKKKSVSRETTKMISQKLSEHMSWLQSEFLEFYRQQKYDESINVLVKILNYAIDFNCKEVFVRTLRKIAEFYDLCSRINFAMFYYNQTKECALLLQDHKTFIESLIGISNCCIKAELHKQSLSVLKKALEYSWYYEIEELELRIYDEIGKVYYLSGQIEKARNYHDRYMQAICEPNISPQKNLSVQRIIKMEELYLESQYDSISLLFLVHLNIPILNTESIPLLEKQTGVPLRDKIEVNQKYLRQLGDVKNEYAKIKNHWLFNEEMNEIDTSYGVATARVCKERSSGGIVNFKLNQQLKDIGVKPIEKYEIKPQDLEYRESLDDKVKRKMQEPKLDPNWAEKISQEIMRDRKNKIYKIQSHIRVRGKNKPKKPQIEEARRIFVSLYGSYS